MRGNQRATVSEKLLRGTGKTRKRAARAEITNFEFDEEEEKRTVDVRQKKKWAGNRRKVSGRYRNHSLRVAPVEQEATKHVQKKAQKAFYGNGRKRNRREKQQYQGRAPAVTSYDYEENILLDQGDANATKDDIENNDNNGSCAECTALVSEINKLREALEDYAGKNTRIFLVVVIVIVELKIQSWLLLLILQLLVQFAPSNPYNSSTAASSACIGKRARSSANDVCDRVVWKVKIDPVKKGR